MPKMEAKKNDREIVSVAFKSTEISVLIPEFWTDFDQPCCAIRFVVPSRCAEIATNFACERSIRINPDTR